MLFANARGTVRASLSAAPDAPWLDLLNASDAEHAAAEHAAGFTLPRRENIAEIENSSRVSTSDGVLYLNTPIAHRDHNGNSAVSPVGFALAEHRLVTIRFAELAVFSSFPEQFAALPDPSSSEAFVGIIEAVVDRVADALEHAAADIDGLSKRTFCDHQPGARNRSRRAGDDMRHTLTSVGQIGDAIANLRDALLGLSRIVAYTQQTAAAWLPGDIKERLTRIRQDIASLNDYDQQLTSKVSFLLDAVLGFINIDQNDIFRILTVVSVVGIPPTFIVGLYGMNFKMPEYSWTWGYEWGLGLIALSIVIPLIWVRWKGWI